MKKTIQSLSPRREFLQSISVGSAALLAGGLGTAAASATPRNKAKAVATSDDWLDRLHGDHRQVFDLVEANNGLGAAYALGFLGAFDSVPDIASDDACAVTVFRHNAFALMLNDRMWEKYKLGEFYGITDPETETPTVRNIFRANIPLNPGLTYERMISERGIIVLACNLALSVHSMMSASNAGVSAEEAEAEWINNTLDGVVLVPTGTYGVHMAQEHGCSYCYAG